MCPKQGIISEQDKRKNEEKQKQRMMIRQLRLQAARRRQDALRQREEAAKHKVAAAAEAEKLSEKQIPVQQPRMKPKSFILVCDALQNKKSGTRRIPQISHDLFVRELQALRTRQAIVQQTTRQSRRDKSRNLVDSESISITKQQWETVSGLHKAMGAPIRTFEDKEKFEKETFVAPFSVHDVKSVCTVGQLIPDVVLYTFAKYFGSNSSKENPLYVENPSFINSVVDLKNLKVNYTGDVHTHTLPITYPCFLRIIFTLNATGLALFMQQRIKKSIPTWGERLQKGIRVLLPVSLPENEHWILVVLSKITRKVYIKILDSMHSTYEEHHTGLVEAVVRVCHLMTGLGGLDIIWIATPVPLEQKLLYNFCAFHVLTRVWMESTRQVGKKITHEHVSMMRRYVQYMILTKNKDIGCDAEGKQEDSDENEFCLE